MGGDIYVVVEHLREQVSDISYVMLAAAKKFAGETGGGVISILLGHGAKDLSGSLASDKVIYADHPALADFTKEAYQQVLVELIERDSPRIVLLGDTSIGSGVAAGLSAELNLPLISSCRMLSVDNGAVKAISQICGGKVMAESVLPDGTSLIAMIPGAYKAEDGRAASPPEGIEEYAPSIADMQIQLMEYIEPETGDVDISRESLLVAVGRGIQREDNIELAEELAQELGAVICASRPVVDQGWLPTSRMVGKSGQTVNPSLYLALGISGAPEHVEGMGESDLIIAINTDATAPIFDIAQYGANVDMFDLIPELIDQIRQAKGG